MSTKSKIKLDFLGGIVESDVTYTDRYIKLKCMLQSSEENFTPYEWLSKFGKASFRQYQNNPSQQNTLRKRVEDVDDAEYASYREHVPFAKERDDFAQDTLLYQNNYFAFDYVNRQLSNVDGFITMGYYDMCHDDDDFAPMRLIWSVLLRLRGGTNESVEDLFTRLLDDSSTPDNRTDQRKVALQQQLAVAMSRVYAAQKKSQRPNVTADAEIDKLLDLLEHNFIAIYQGLAARHAENPQNIQVENQGADGGAKKKRSLYDAVLLVWAWPSPDLTCKHISIVLQFFITAGWLAPKAMLMMQEERYLNFQNMSDMVLLVNLGSEMFYDSNPFMQWMQTVALFLRNMKYNDGLQAYQDALMQCPYPYMFFVNLPFFCMASFLYTRGNDRRRNSRNLMLTLAGLVSVNDFYRDVPPSFYADLRSNTLLGARQLASRVGLFVGQPIQIYHSNELSETSMSLCKRHAPDFAASCPVITRFGIFYTLQVLHSEPLSWSAHSRQSLVLQLRNYAFQELKLSEENQLEKNTQRLVLSQQKGMVDSERQGGDLAQFAVDCTVNAWQVLRDLPVLFYDGVRQSTDHIFIMPSVHSDPRIDVDSVMTHFEIIRELWDHIFEKVLPRANHRSGSSRCILMDYAQNMTVARALQPCLLASVKQAVGLSNVSLGFGESSLDALIQEILKGEVGEDDICARFEFPDTASWMAPPAYDSARDMIHYTSKFVKGFKGFENLKNLSDIELDTMLKKYSAFQIPNPATWGIHLIQHDHAGISHLLSKLLMHKAGASSSTVMITTMTGTPAPQMAVSEYYTGNYISDMATTTFALGILNLMQGNDGGISEATLSTIPQTARHFAVQFASDTKIPWRLVETALRYMARHAPLGVGPHSLAPSSYAEVFARAFVMIHEAPLIPILSRWFLHRQPDHTSKLQRYYSINPDILVSSLIRDLSLMIIFIIDSDNKNLGSKSENWRGGNVKLVAGRLQGTMVFAKDNLEVTLSAMQDILVFLMDYFGLHQHSDESLGMASKYFITEAQQKDFYHNLILEKSLDPLAALAMQTMQLYVVTDGPMDVFDIRSQIEWALRRLHHEFFRVFSTGLPQVQKEESAWSELLAKYGRRMNPPPTPPVVSNGPPMQRVSSFDLGSFLQPALKPLIL